MVKKKLIWAIFLMATGVVMLWFPKPVITKTLDSPFGINGFITTRFNGQDLARSAKTLKDLGIDWTREEFFWQGIEPEKDKFNFAFYDNAVSETKKSGLNILGLLDYGTGWASSSPDPEPGRDKYMPKNIEDWDSFVGHVVSRYKKDIKYWQIWNEPNIATFWKPEPSPNDYCRLLQASYKTIKSIDPDAKIVLGGTSGVDLPYLKKIIDCGANSYYDILAVHPYRPTFTMSPENNGYISDLDKIISFNKEFGWNKPIWITELGWPTDSREGVSEEKQAAYLIRAYLLALSRPEISKIFWYDFRDDGNDKTYREHNFGIITRDYDQKVSFNFLKSFIKVFDHSSFDSYQVANDVYIFKFIRSNDTKELYFIWKSSGESKIAVSNLDHLFYLDGTEYSINSHQWTELNINYQPLMITGSNIEFQTDQSKLTNHINKKLYDFELLDQSPPLKIKKGESTEVWFKIKNTGLLPWLDTGYINAKLGTVNPQDRRSLFIDKSWLSDNRVTTLGVDTGESATVKFKMSTNSLLPGIYQEAFAVVIENAGWIPNKTIDYHVEVLP